MGKRATKLSKLTARQISLKIRGSQVVVRDTQAFKQHKVANISIPLMRISSS